MANKPNNPSLWSKAKSLAKQKFDVYPSAYANGWAAKWYKGHGGTWRKAEYGMEVPYMRDGGKPEWLLEAQLKAQGYSGDALDQKINSMSNGGEPQNPGFQALPEYVQNKIMNNMAFGGYIPEMATGGWAQQAAIAIAMKKAGKKPKSMKHGGDPDGAMALGQIDAAIDKLSKLRQYIKPDSDLEPWVNSKLTLMDDYASAVSDYMSYNPEAQGEEEMMDEESMEQMRDGGIPQRYKNMGFTHVGQKKQGDGKHKWKVLAKKGDQYKVVQGGWRGMQDFKQHHSEKRRDRFWDRMGGRNSYKATDPFSPLYWHKRFGTWENGGEIDMPEMKAGGSTWSGNAWYKMGGQPCYECGGMYAEGGESEMMMPEPDPAGYNKRNRTRAGRFLSKLGVKPISQWSGANDGILENLGEIFLPGPFRSALLADDVVGAFNDKRNPKSQFAKFANIASMMAPLGGVSRLYRAGMALPKAAQYANTAISIGDAAKGLNTLSHTVFGNLASPWEKYNYGGQLTKYQDLGTVSNDSIPYGHMNIPNFIPQQGSVSEVIEPQSFIPASSTVADYSLGSINDPSIVNYLATRNQDFSFAVRAELAKKYGIVSDKSEYRGTSEQNVALLKKLRESGDYGDVVTSQVVDKVIGASSNAPVQIPLSAVDSASQVLNNSANSGVVLPTTESRTNSLIPYMVGAGAAGALGYKAYKAGIPQMVGRGVDAVLSNPNVYKFYDKDRYLDFLRRQDLYNYYSEGVPPVSSATSSLPTIKPQSSLPRFMPEISYPPVQKIRTRTMTPEMKKANTKAIKEFLKKEAAKGAAVKSASYWDDFIRLASKTGQKMLRRKFQDGSEVTQADNLSNRIYNYLDDTNILDHLWDYSQIGASPEQKLIWQAQYGKRNPLNNNHGVRLAANIGQYFVPYYGTSLLGAQLSSALGSNNLPNEDKAVEVAAAAIPYGVAKVAKKGYRAIKRLSKKEYGGIHINPAHKGDFTDYCGGNVTGDCIQRGLNSPDPHVRQMANFARNARSWKHEMGGENYVPEYQVGGSAVIGPTVHRGSLYEDPQYGYRYDNYVQVQRPEGTRYYMASGRSMNDVVAEEKARSNAFAKISNYPADSIPRLDPRIQKRFYAGGGPVVGDEMNVTPEQLEELRRQGYQFEMI